MMITEDIVNQLDWYCIKEIDEAIGSAWYGNGPEFEKRDEKFYTYVLNKLKDYFKENY